MENECEKAFEQFIGYLVDEQKINLAIREHVDDEKYFKLTFDWVMEKHFDPLEKRIKKMEECLKWYADSSKWQDMPPTLDRYYKKGEGVMYKDKDTGLVLCEGGHKARQCLAKVE